MTLDGFDIAILRALQQDGAMTNATLSERVNLSASQCSRRRAALEAASLIAGYSARLDAAKLGFGFRAIVRVNLRSHGGGSESGFAKFIARCSEVRAAFSVSGDADYIFDVRTPDLGSFAAFIHEQLLPHELVAQVRSEIVLKTLKDEPGVDLSRLPAPQR
ncbi:Lrp/AsnC family transcriptional regulator [Pseudohoeflea suaedae]|uniref:Lrp/AsnC family transcriptional regulator n=1 Tax=Pseudohoeflea suaedae TaxID=877384 RepID=A0A4R5PJY3_9HYPH|nr:Lrp/AsnC family transcriptional regulator [Pseudohoeflea suaedae]TDH35204.1 Lrp/AsnC family transcriptional regulator [Pseudohoeflea suaedae]